MAGMQGNTAGMHPEQQPVPVGDLRQFLNDQQFVKSSALREFPSTESYVTEQRMRGLVQTIV